MPPLFALVDCNNFYPSVERVFAPALQGKPVIVLSSNDGCVIARSNEAKALGIAMGVPEFQIRSLIRAHSIHVLSSNYTLYGDMSQRVMETLEQFCPDIEVYSIDECFLSFSGFRSRNLTDYSHTIRTTVQRWTGIPVSIGIAETKTLAKLANRIAKRTPNTHGVVDLRTYPDRSQLLSQIPVEEIWGIGSSYARLLNAHGITSAQHLTQRSDQWIRKQLGIVGLRLVMELRGISCLTLEDCPPPKHSLTCARSFGHTVETLTEMEEAISTYTTRLAEKLRRGKLAATTLTVFLSTNYFSSDPPYRNTMTVTLPIATDLTHELVHQSLHSIRTIYRDGHRYKKAGVLLTGLVPVSQIQTDLFTDHTRVRSAPLMTALDTINTRWGAGTVHYASNGFAKSWQPKAFRRSPAYTTDWSALPIVHAS